MTWDVVFHDQFAIEFEQLKVGVQDELLAHAVLLRDYGPGLGRPTVDTLKGCKHANMKEMRFSHGKDVWRVAFAFDRERKAVLLVAGNKVGADQRLFYKRLIDKADLRLAQHLLATKSQLKTAKSAASIASTSSTSSTSSKENRHGKKTG